MVLSLLGMLVVVDIVMIFAIFLLSRRQAANSSALAELHEERSLLTELRESVKEELENALAKIRGASDKVQILAAEVEYEIKNGAGAVTQEADAMIKELSKKFDEPLDELMRRQQYIESLMKRMDQEKKVIHRIVSRGEQVLKFFNGKVSYEKIVQEIEDQKHSDVRALLARGLKAPKIATELGMTEAEVRAISNIGA